MPDRNPVEFATEIAEKVLPRLASVGRRPRPAGRVNAAVQKSELDGNSEPLGSSSLGSPADAAVE